jgi:hypothetical protein
VRSVLWAAALLALVSGCRAERSDKALGAEKRSSNRGESPQGQPSAGPAFEGARAQAADQQVEQPPDEVGENGAAEPPSEAAPQVPSPPEAPRPELPEAPQAAPPEQPEQQAPPANDVAAPPPAPTIIVVPAPVLLVPNVVPRRGPRVLRVPQPPAQPGRSNAPAPAGQMPTSGGNVGTPVPPATQTPR